MKAKGHRQLRSTSASHSPLPTSWPQAILAGKGELGVSHLLDPLKLLYLYSSDKVLASCPPLAPTFCLSLASRLPQSRGCHPHPLAGQQPGLKDALGFVPYRECLGTRG